MAIKQFAIPLNSNSIQTGDITLKGLVDNDQPVTFQLTNVSSGSTNQLDLITNNNGTQTSHKFTATISGGKASVDLTAAQVKSIYDAADDVDWDYVVAYWTVGAVDTPEKSNTYEVQNTQIYNTHDWPPKIH